MVSNINDPKSESTKLESQPAKRKLQENQGDPSSKPAEKSSAPSSPKAAPKKKTRREEIAKKNQPDGSSSKSFVVVSKPSHDRNDTTTAPGVSIRSDLPQTSPIEPDHAQAHEAMREVRLILKHADVFFPTLASNYSFVPSHQLMRTWTQFRGQKSYQRTSVAFLWVLNSNVLSSLMMGLRRPRTARLRH